MNNKKPIGVETLQMVLDNIQALVYVTEVDTYNIIFANKFLKAKYGEDVEGKKCWSILSGCAFTDACPFCNLQNILHKPLGVPTVWEHYNPGMNAWMHINETLAKWPDGRLAHIVVLSDITDIKKNEQALKDYKDQLETLLVDKTESEQSLKAMSDNLPSSFVFQLKEVPGKPVPDIAYISKGVENICGLNPEQLGSDIMPLLSLFHPEDLGKLQEEIAKNTSFHLEVRLQVPNKKGYTWILFSEVPRINHQKEVIWDGIAMDITDRKNTEEELQRSQAKLLHNANLLQEISDNMVNSSMYRSHLSQEGRIILDYAGSRMEEITGIPLEEFLKGIESFVQYVHPDDREEFVDRIKATTGKLSTEKTEFRYILHGETKWYRMQSVGVEQNGTVYRDGFVMDITDQKVFELELINARKKAEESEKLKSTFLANMSHEIRTPMNAIIGFLEFLTNEEDITPEEQKEYMRIVSDNANQLLKLIGDILDISKIDAGQMHITPEETNLNVLLQDIHASFMASGVMNAEKHIELLVNEEGQDQRELFSIDSVRVRQILNNLIGNAIKFTDNGYVKFGYKVIKEGLHFSVEDTGIGISKEKIESLGKPFHQLHDQSLSYKYGGTGIGLAISINLVRLMGGRFWVESEPGKGSTFHFYIPCKEVEAINGAHPYSEVFKNQEVPDYDLHGHTILIAEDVSTNLGYLKALLQPTRATLLIALDGEEAVEMVRTHPEIEIVLMDVRMPGMDGLEATIHIKDLRPELPVIGQTAFMSKEDQESMTLAGFDDFIGKPIKGMELHEKINWFLK